MQEYTEEYKGYTISVCRDDNAQSPDDWGSNDVFLVGFHRQFFVQRNGFGEEVIGLLNEKEIYDESLAERVKQIKKEYHVFPLYAYIHSGIALSLKDPSDTWDSGMVGYVLVKKTLFKTTKKAWDAAQALVGDWRAYLDGDIYAVSIKELDDSSSGWVSQDGAESGISEAKAIIDAHIKSYTEHGEVRRVGVCEHSGARVEQMQKGDNWMCLHNA